MMKTGCHTHEKRVSTLGVFTVKTRKQNRRLWAIVLIGSILFACSSEPYSAKKQKVEPQNIFLIIACTLRASYLGAYGYHKPISPNIDRLAAQGTLFEHCYSQAPFTRDSMASIITSKYPRNIYFSKVAGMVLADENLTLAEILTSQGFKTFCFSANPWISRFFNFQQGYQEFFDTVGSFQISHGNPVRKVRKEKVDGQEITDAVLAVLDEDNAPKRFFTLVYTDTHFPYKKTPKLGKGYNRYDASISRLDTNIGRLLDGLKSRDLLEKSLIIFTADHGEGLAENHEYDKGHGFFLYNSVVRVPLILFGKEIRKSTRINTVVPSLDITPTILDLIGIPHASLDGKSLKPVLTGQDSRSYTKENIFIETNFNNDYKVRKAAVIHQGRWKYIKNFDDHFKGNPYEEELYDLAADPLESNNLTRKDENLKKKLDQVLQDWLKKQPKPPVKVNIKDRWKIRKSINRQLKALGYIN